MLDELERKKNFRFESVKNRRDLPDEYERDCLNLCGLYINGLRNS